MAPTVTLPIAPVWPGGTVSDMVQEYGSPVTGVQLLDHPPKAGVVPLLGVVRVTVTPTGKFPVHRDAEAPAEQLIGVSTVPVGEV